MIALSRSARRLLAAVLIGLPALLAAAESATNQIAVAPALNLPLVLLEAKEPIVSEKKVSCTVKVVSLDGAKPARTNQWPGVARIHGASSQGYAKKSFGLTLEAPARLLDLREDAHWVLNASYVDRSLMRHKLSYDLFRSLSTKSAGRFAVDSRFVEVYLNGKYHGAYLLMERVDRQLFELPAYRSNDVSHACIYKAVDHAANFSQPGHAGYEQREPDPVLKPWWQPLDEFNQFVSTSSNADFFQPQTGIAARLDLDNAIDFHLLVLLTSNTDGITKNFIIARGQPETGTASARFFFAPWDYDATFGRNWNATEVVPTLWLSNHLFNRLLGHREYRDQFVARWKQLREQQFSAKTIHGLIDANARTLGEAAQRNAARWSASDGSYPDKLTFEEDTAQMKSWTEARLKWLDEEIVQKLGRK